jgi:type IV conjugative transfer system protein TraE
MKAHKYLDRVSNLTRENRLLKFCVLVFATASAISAIASYHSLKYTRTIVTPAVVSTGFTVTENHINEDGIKMFTRYAFDLFLNYTPDSAEAKFKELLNLIHTRYFARVNEDLIGQIENIKRLKIVSTYMIEQISIDEKDRLIKVRGLRERTSYSSPIDKLVEEWELAYEIVESNFKIVRIKKEDKPG